MHNGTQCFAAAIHQVRAGDGSSSSVRPNVARTKSRVLEVDELSILTSWAEAAAEVLIHAPERTTDVLAHGHADAQWRSGFGLARPSDRLRYALEALIGLADAAAAQGLLTAEGVVSIADQPQAPDSPLESLVRRVLVSMIEERRTR